MKNIYFDLCSIPFYILILWTCYSRKLTQGRANRIFVLMNWLSLACVAADIGMEYVVNPLPLSPGSMALGTAISFIYKALRNAGIVVYLRYIFAITRTDYRLRPLKNRLLLWLPYALLVLVLVQSLFTESVFSISARSGYSRGPMLTFLYVVALLYGVAGTLYCIYCKRYLETHKWMALISVYVLMFASVVIQLLNPDMMVEMFATCVGIMMVLLVVIRPEETMDNALGIQNWNTFRRYMRNMLLSRQHCQLLVVQIVNTQEIRTYLGEERYNSYLGCVAEALRRIGQHGHGRVNAELYVERPGTFYLTLDDADFEAEEAVRTFLTEAEANVKPYTDLGARFAPKLLLLRCPEDMSDMEEIVNLCHKFPQLCAPDQVLLRAADAVASRDYDIFNHMERILNRAVTENRLEIHYQPIYALGDGHFHSAEALARLNDPEYGMIPPGVFIPAAETLGLIVPIGERVMESVFSFIAGHDLEALGLSFIEINLSVEQVLQPELPQTVRRLQERYGVKPSQVNFEITETIYANLSDVMDRNVQTLRRMGYTFSLDDYGTGYSNIQRMSKLPLDIVKIDKSLVDDMFTENGAVILTNTVRMMQGIHKKLVVEGVETRSQLEALEKLSCDYIQGYYYSKPLPEQAFVAFVEERRTKGTVQPCKF